MKRLRLLLIVIILISNTAYADGIDSLSLGIAGGYNSYKTFRGEVYMKLDLEIFRRNGEVKFGINNRSYDLAFDGVAGLDASSIGIFGDVAIYPFNKILFTGIRWELINLNWLNRNSRTRFKNEKNYTPNSLYSGTCVFFQLGCAIKITKKIGLKLYGQPGVQYFKITNGSFSSGNYVHTNLSEEEISENHTKAVYNLNLGIEIKIK